AARVHARVDVARRPPQRLAVSVEVARGVEEERHRQLRHVGGHRRRRVRDRQAVEERAGETSLHLAAAMGHQPEAGGGLGQRRVEARAVPGGEQRVHDGEARAEAGGEGPRPVPAPAVEARQPAPARGVEERGEERLSREHEETRLAPPHTTFNSPRPDRASLRTSSTTSTAAKSGTRLAVIRIGLNEKRSATTPMRNVATIVPAPAAAPAIPATDATARFSKRSAGRASAIVDNVA